MKPFETFCFLAWVSTIPVLAIWIVSFAVVGGFWPALTHLGPAMAVIYPPIAVWLTYNFAKG